jgi:Subunit ChlI of Mg-chelatase
MLASVLSATLPLIDGRVIRVEVDVAPGLPGFSVVGLADASLQEARERVRGAVRNSGLVFPHSAAPDAARTEVDGHRADGDPTHPSTRVADVNHNVYRILKELPPNRLRLTPLS